MLFIIISFWYNFQCGLSVLPPASFVPELIWRKNLCLGVAETPTSHGEQESLVAAFRLSAVNLTYKTRDSVSQNNEVGLYIEARSCIPLNLPPKKYFSEICNVLLKFSMILSHIMDVIIYHQPRQPEASVNGEGRHERYGK